MKQLRHTAFSSTWGRFLWNAPDAEHFDWHKEVGSPGKDKQEARNTFYEKLGQEKQDLRAEVLEKKELFFSDELLSIQLARFFGELQEGNVEGKNWGKDTHKKTFDVLKRLTDMGLNVDNPKNFVGKKLIFDADGEITLEKIGKGLKWEKDEKKQEQKQEKPVENSKQQKRIQELEAEIANLKKQIEETPVATKEKKNGPNTDQDAAKKQELLAEIARLEALRQQQQEQKREQVQEEKDLPAEIIQEEEEKLRTEKDILKQKESWPKTAEEIEAEHKELRKKAEEKIPELQQEIDERQAEVKEVAEAAKTSLEQAKKSEISPEKILELQKNSREKLEKAQDKIAQKERVLKATRKINASEFVGKNSRVLTIEDLWEAEGQETDLMKQYQQTKETVQQVRKDGNWHQVENRAVFEDFETEVQKLDRLKKAKKVLEPMNIDQPSVDQFSSLQETRKWLEEAKERGPIEEKLGTDENPPEEEKAGSNLDKFLLLEIRVDHLHKVQDVQDLLQGSEEKGFDPLPAPENFQEKDVDQYLPHITQANADIINYDLKAPELEENQKYEDVDPEYFEGKYLEDSLAQKAEKLGKLVEKFALFGKLDVALEDIPNRLKRDKLRKRELKKIDDPEDLSKYKSGVDVIKNVLRELWKNHYATPDAPFEEFQKIQLRALPAQMKQELENRNKNAYEEFQNILQNYETLETNVEFNEAIESL
ncbi:MAG: hypothetical protein K9M51_01870 [Candidatus Gracilibacteria bacterium]|nr:hypothetical protein [Candidatus Gracilibacteria bacterium]